MDYDKETIAAPATPSGGAIGIIRLSGPAARPVLDTVFCCAAKDKAPARLYHGFIQHNGRRIDEVMAAVFDAPHSYTGEDMAEIYCHGGSVCLSGVLGALIQSGARLAEPGEFTKRAFLAGKMDLSAAGAVMELIEATSAAGAGAALRQLSGGLFEKITVVQQRLTDALAMIEAGIEYPEEDIEADIKRDVLPLLLSAKGEVQKLADTFASGRMLKEGYSVVIAGRPNVGKSSLFNMLLNKQRAIVTRIPGTTRDAVDDTMIKDGVLIRLIDTAGIRQGADEVESIGIARARSAVENAGLTLLVIDAAAGITDEDRQIADTLGGSTLVVLNKCDLPQRISAGEARRALGREVAEVSALTGLGRDRLLAGIRPPAVSETEDVVITNERHLRILDAARQSLSAALGALETADLDCVTIDIKDAWDSLGEITGVTVTEEIIDTIFDKFCLGK